MSGARNYGVLNISVVHDTETGDLWFEAISQAKLNRFTFVEFRSLLHDQEVAALEPILKSISERVHVATQKWTGAPEKVIPVKQGFHK